MEIRQLEARDEAAVDRFLDRIPEGDRTFFKEDVDEPEVRAAWFRPGTARLLAVEEDAVIGYVAVVPLQGWSSHVGEVRVIVDPSLRGRGVGRALARRAVLEALKLGLTKMMIEVVADQEAAIGMFRSLGFVPEALLKDHVRDQSGRLRDLLVLAHAVEESWGALTAAGIAEAV
ncbi:MAG TPA: GNAT family N-acetyltransferase [Gaiellaceae bacterium]